jgi:hypothetical protein
MAVLGFTRFAPGNTLSPLTMPSASTAAKRDKRYTLRENDLITVAECNALIQTRTTTPESPTTPQSSWVPSSPPSRLSLCSLSGQQSSGDYSEAQAAERRQGAEEGRPQQDDRQREGGPDRSVREAGRCRGAGEVGERRADRVLQDLGQAGTDRGAADVKGGLVIRVVRE